MSVATDQDHEHGCARDGCFWKFQCCEDHSTAAIPVRRCELHDVRVRGEDACPWCDGTGSFAKVAYYNHTEWVPCTMCKATGQRTAAK